MIWLLAWQLWSLPARAAAVPLFMSGEAGIALVWIPNATGTTNPISLTGFTVTMSRKRASDNKMGTNSCVVAQDGFSASCTLLSTDFPTGGMYTIQWTATQGATIRKSPVVTINVGTNL